jgi:hypothetical protein
VYKSGTDPVADFGMYRNTRVGDFTGQVVYAGPAGLAKRDLEVSIRRERSGFSLKWTTISQRASGKLKRAAYFVAFAPAKRPGFYLSTDRIDRLGARIPIDPLAGDPQVWAKISNLALKFAQSAFR